MSDIRDFTESIGFIVFFLVLALTIGMFLGEKVQFWFLIILLLSMALLNADKVKELFSKIKFSSGLETVTYTGGGGTGGGAGSSRSW